MKSLNMKIKLCLLLPLAWFLSTLIDIIISSCDLHSLRNIKTCSNNIWCLLLMSRNNECEVLYVEWGCPLDSAAVLFVNSWQQKKRVNWVEFEVMCERYV